MKGHLYILDENHQPVEVEDVVTWGQWFETANRTVGDTTIGDSRVSTVFLGLNHSHILGGEGPPVLFETMIFGGPLASTNQANTLLNFFSQWLKGEIDEYPEELPKSFAGETRYCTWEQAVRGHELWVERVKEFFEIDHKVRTE